MPFGPGSARKILNELTQLTALVQSRLTLDTHASTMGTDDITNLYINIVFKSIGMTIATTQLYFHTDPVQ
jgi:hypothetical protein